MATLSWHGHPCFTLVTDDGTRLPFDPWLNGNPAADIRTVDVARLDYILVTRGHFDHFADCGPTGSEWVYPGFRFRGSRLHSL
jgi:L-ascorbate metabolism protein UlaG (beta-lactamase superfamily)